jgi:hypothetical protein
MLATPIFAGEMNPIGSTVQGLVPPEAVLRDIWAGAALPPEALARARLTGAQAVVPSSFRLGTALQASVAAAALAASEIGGLRGGALQTVSVEAADAVREGACRFTLDGRPPVVWQELSGLYRCSTRASPAWVRVHANFTHHRDGVLKLLGLPTGSATQRVQVEQALASWQAEDFEAAAAEKGLVVAAVRSVQQWIAHAQAPLVAATPLVAIERVGDAPPRPWHRLDAQDPCLQGLRVLDLTRILAGPVAGRTLAAYGADVLLVNSPSLPNIEAIAETSRGKLSTHLDLKQAPDRETFLALVREADIVLQAYRPGALAALGLGPRDLARERPGIVYVSLSAYGERGPWGGRRGFDSLVQSAIGLNLAEAEMFGAEEPRALPLQALDYSAGFLMAFGALAALMRQRREGGSWNVRVSLARVGHWLHELGRLPEGLQVKWPSFDGAMETTDTSFGRLVAVRHAARFSHTQPCWRRPAMPPGSHAPQWPPRAE